MVGKRGIEVRTVFLSLRDGVTIIPLKVKGKTKSAKKGRGRQADVKSFRKVRKEKGRQWGHRRRVAK